MKTTRILFFIFLAFTVNGQTFDELTGEMMIDGVSPIDFRDGEMYLTDSTFNYVIDTVTGEVDSIGKSVNLSFNNYGQIIESIAYSRGSNSTGWIPTVRSVYSYDEEGGLLELHDYHWNDSLEEWGRFERRYYTPSEYGAVLTVIQKWNEAGDEWENESRQIASFVNVGKPEYQWREKWDTLTASWNKEWRMDFAYDNGEKLKAQLFSKWDSIRWVNHNQSFFFYDPDGNIEYKYINAWYDGNWHKIARLTYGDNMYDQWQTMTHYIWNSVDSLWGVYKMEEREFGDNEKITFHAHKTWVVDHWQYTFNNVMEYDENDNAVRFELQKFNNGEWQSVSGSAFFFSNHGSSLAVEDVMDSGISCDFPNPYSGQPINVIQNGEVRKLEVRLYDLCGRLHYRNHIGQQKFFSIANDLPAGTYLLVLVREGRIPVVKKMIILGN